MLAQGTSVYTWDAANRLVSAEVDGVVSAFEYNGLGQRMAQTVDGLTTEYVLDVAGGLPEVIIATAGGASTYYVQVQGQILGQYDSEEWAYALPDHLGSLRQLVDGDGQVSLAQSFDPFGSAFESSGAGASDFGYTGEAWDSQAELLFLRARYYDPAMGRFVSQDPWPGDILRPPTLNGWSYVENHPINFTDPTGYIKEEEASDANEIVERLLKEYQVRVLKDWGYGYEVSSGVSGWARSSCRWEEGHWTLDELENALEAGVTNLGSALGGPDRFIAQVGGVTVYKKAIRPPAQYWLRRIEFKITEMLSERTVIHELGHAWDANFGWRLSEELEEFTGGSTNPEGGELLRAYWRCDAMQRLPGCNDAGYFYRGKPPFGSDRNFDRREDFAESVLAYVHPDWTQATVEQFRGDEQLEELLFYTDYAQTLRWAYISYLIHGTITSW